MFESTRARLLLLGIGFAASSFAAAVMNLAYSYLTYQITGRASIAVVASACLVLPLAVLVKATGAVLRRRSAKAVLVTTIIVTIASYLAGTIAIMAGDISVPFLLLMALVAGVGQAFIYPAWMVFVTQTAPRDRMEEVNAGLSSWWAVGAVLGVLSGGLIQGHLGPAWLFIVSSVAMIPMVLSLAVIRSAPNSGGDVVSPEAEPAKLDAPSLKETLAYVRRTPILWAGLAMLVVTELVGYSLLSVMPALANEVDPTPETYALLMASFYLGLFFVDIWMHRIHRRRSTRSLIVIALVILFALLAISPLLGLLPDGTVKLVMFMVVLSPIGLMIVVVETFYESAQQVGGTDDGNVPYVLALFSAVGAVVGTIGGFALAAVIDLSNVFYALLLAGLIWGAFLYYVHRARHLDSVNAVSVE
ncbi:MAG: MFS transporter [Actinobacteria bacterium]|uniref:Unannotated protein n=1 Tax=freshwater metagenome TaxID=449393 RepID=A0A6J7DJZ3_9ZZZZ|nr:MFS transporter [Actinomycetota bacterium]